jgi:hypothetical protein
MKVRITENVLINGMHIKAGEIAEVSKEDAAMLKNIKRAVDPGDGACTHPANDEYLNLASEMTNEALRSLAKEFKINIEKLSREDANRAVAEAMKKAEGA